MNSLIIIRGESKAELFFSPMLWRIKINESSWIWLALTLLVALSAVVAPGTLRPSSILATLPFASMLAIIAVGQTIVVQQRVS
jgi:ribose/xylose/arabinose/galactoside ABC-type transport system permease subunit